MLGDFFADAGETGWHRLLSDVGVDEIVFDTGESTAVDLTILAEQAGAALFGGPLLPGVAVGALAAYAGDTSLVEPLRDGTRTVGFMPLKPNSVRMRPGGVDALLQLI